MPSKIHREMGEIAAFLETMLTQLYGFQVGFALVVYPLDKPVAASYISNAEREGMIAALRHTADRLEQNQDIGPTIGEA